MKPETPTKTELRSRIALLEQELEVRTSQLEQVQRLYDQALLKLAQQQTRKGAA
jgi:hypothetical protein